MVLMRACRGDVLALYKSVDLRPYKACIDSHLLRLDNTPGQLPPGAMDMPCETLENDPSVNIGIYNHDTLCTLGLECLNTVSEIPTGPIAEPTFINQSARARSLKAGILQAFLFHWRL